MVNHCGKLRFFGSTARAMPAKRLLLLFICPALYLVFPCTEFQVSPIVSNLTRSISADSYNNAFGIKFVAGGEVVKALKRAVNQGWRNGARYICDALAADYEYVKSQLYLMPAAFPPFKALCIQMDRLDLEIQSSTAGEEGITPAQQQLRYLLLSKAAAYLNHYIGIRVVVPAKYIPPNVVVDEVGGDQTQVSTNYPTEEREKFMGLQSAAKDNNVSVPAEAMQTSPAPPSAEDFDRGAREQLANLQKQHSAETQKIAEMQRQNLQVMVADHESQTKKLLSQLQEKQVAELVAVRTELEERRNSFLNAVGAYEAASKALLNVKELLHNLHSMLGQMQDHYNGLVAIRAGLLNMQKVLKQNSTDKVQSACLRSAFQSEKAAPQVMSKVLNLHQEGSRILEHIRTIFQDVDSALAIRIDNNPSLHSFKQVLSERVEHYRAAGRKLSARLEETVQAAEERKLVILYVSEELRKEVYDILKKHMAELNTVLETLSHRFGSIEHGFNKVAQLNREFGRRVLDAVQETLKNPEIDQFETAAEDIKNIKVLAAEVRDELQKAMKNIQSVEQEFRMILENLRASEAPNTTFESLGISGAYQHLQSVAQKGIDAQELLQQTKLSIQSTDEALRVIRVLQKEAQQLHKPEVLAQVKKDLEQNINDLRVLNETKARTDLQLQHLTVDINQLISTAHHLKQRLALERKTANLDLNSHIQSQTGPFSTAGHEEVKRASIESIEEELKQATEQIEEKRREFQEKQNQSKGVEQDLTVLAAKVKQRQKILSDEQLRRDRIKHLSKTVLQSFERNMQTDSSQTIGLHESFKPSVGQSLGSIENNKPADIQTIGSIKADNRVGSSTSELLEKSLLDGKNETIGSFLKNNMTGSHNQNEPSDSNRLKSLVLNKSSARQALEASGWNEPNGSLTSESLEKGTLSDGNRIFGSSEKDMPAAGR